MPTLLAQHFRLPTGPSLLLHSAHYCSPCDQCISSIQGEEKMLLWALDPGQVSKPDFLARMPIHVIFDLCVLLPCWFRIQRGRKIGFINTLKSPKLWRNPGSAMPSVSVSNTFLISLALRVAVKEQDQNLALRAHLFLPIMDKSKVIKKA